MISVKGVDPKMIANNIEPSEPIHPGELLKDEIEYRGISQKELAEQIGISYKILNDILNCRRSVSTNTALLFEAALGIPAHILTGMQMDYNLQLAKNDKSFMERLARIRKIAAVLWGIVLREVCEFWRIIAIFAICLINKEIWIKEIKYLAYCFRCRCF